MTPDELTTLTQTIREQITELTHRLLDAKEQSKPVSLDEPMGRLSRMDAMQHQQMDKERVRLAERRLKALQATLRRIEAGTYGECGACGEEIAYGRLVARPEVGLCTACQRARE